MYIVINQLLKKFLFIFSQIKYIIISFGTFFLLFLSIIIIQNYQLFTFFFFTQQVMWQEKIFFLTGIFKLFAAQNTLYSGLMTLLLIILMSINISLFVYYLQNYTLKKRALGTSILGITLGFLGIGCSACGSLLVTAIFGVSFATGFITVLPFKGKEFLFLGVVLVIGSCIYQLYRLQYPKTCSIK